MNQKGKVFSLIAVSGAMLFSFALLGKNFDFLGARAVGGISEPINSSVVFTRNDTFKTIGTYKYSVKSRTPNNTDVYAIIDCKTTFSSSYIASFPSKSDTDYETKIYFSEDENGQKPFLFQKVTAIKFTFNSGSANICIGSFSGTDYEYDNFESFESGVSKEINHTANKEVRIKGPTKDNRQLITRPVKSIELFFTCDYNYIPPVEHSISSAPTTNGSITLEKTSYFRDDEVKFTVTPNDGYYASSVTTSDPDTVPIDHTMYYSFLMPDNDVEIRATFEEIPSSSHTVSIRTVTGGSVSCIKTEYYENELVQLTANPTIGYEVDSIITNPMTQVSGSGNIYSFSMPNENVEVIPAFKKSKYLLSLDPYEHGTVTNFPSGLHEMGDLINFNIAGESGYQVDKVLCNDTEIQGTGGNYSFTMPAEVTVVKVTFKAAATTVRFDYTYSLTGTLYSLYLSSDGTGYEISDGKTCTFKYTISDVNYSFELIDDGGMSGQGYIFSSASSTTGTLNGNTLVIKIGFQNKNFTKQ